MEWTGIGFFNVVTVLPINAPVLLTLVVLTLRPRVANIQVIVHYKQSIYTLED